jgi:hypothetical protein
MALHRSSGMPPQQLELLPSDNAVADKDPWKPPGAIPPALRTFSKFFDTSNWRAGDLVLEREMTPDWVGEKIVAAQIRGGYAIDDARWTHAAMYLGDSLTVCESTFSTLVGARGVLLTPLWKYCGSSAIRVRRPRVLDDRGAWLLAIRGLTQLRKNYDFKYIIKLGWVAYRGKGFWAENARLSLSPSALVCSTLYADAFAKQTRRALGEQNNGLCTPAYLSQSDEFDEVPLAWLTIKGTKGENPTNGRRD